jgi:CubicO group peptidase (beta-lactamase class C family)
LAQLATPIEATSLDQKLGLAVEDMLKYCFERDLLNGVVIGIIRDGETQIGVAGSGVSEDCGFEIGSITKAFTVELTDILVSRGIVKWEDPVVLYLSDELKEKNKHVAGERQIRLIDLANHHSGIPLMPPDMKIVERDNTYGDFSRGDLEQYLRTFELRLPDSSRFLYSNVGFALLGYVIEEATGRSYAEMLQKELLLPLGLSQTALALVGQPAPEIVQGHSRVGRPTRRWTQQAFAPAGALCSTVHDLLHWLQFILDHPDRRTLGYGTETLTDENVLGWEIHSMDHSFHRSGLTGGFTSYCSVHPGERSGFVFLSNRNSLYVMRAITLNIERQLRGLDPLPLYGDYGKSRAKILDVVHRGATARRLSRLIRSTRWGANVLDMLKRDAR